MAKHFFLFFLFGQLWYGPLLTATLPDWLQCSALEIEDTQDGHSMQMIPHNGLQSLLSNIGSTLLKRRKVDVKKDGKVNEMLLWPREGERERERERKATDMSRDR